MPDHWIRKMALEQGMISPFEEKLQRQGVISYGLSSYGYDARVSDDFKIFTNIDNALVDPKDFSDNSFVTRKTDVCIIPPNSFVLAHTVEYFKIPRDVLVVCLGKSTYARCGLIVNVTPLEPEWEGHVTLEISYTTPLPAKVYAHEGISQFLFLKADSLCETSYADRGGKYMKQTGVTLPRMERRSCPVCASYSVMCSVKKVGIDYCSCASCGALFSGDLTPDIIATHNDSPGERCAIEIQRTRLQRIKNHLGRMPEKILDFGCGRGDLVDFLKGEGVNAVGVDQHTKLQLSDMPSESLDVVTMVEVIEHLGDPLGILKQLADSLKPGGVLYIESSFVDFLGNPATSDYVDPRIGHCCIHSKKSIAYLGEKLTLGVTWVNNNVVIMHKGRI